MADQTETASSSHLDQDLRPARWEEYIGQQRIKDNLSILLRAATERGQPPEHLLFYGPPGLGKTTLAHLIATELNAQIKVTSGPAIGKVGDLASILTNLSSGDILFIDEIHRLNKSIEEVLYPAMESGSLDIILGKGPSARTIQLELPPFTLIAATTRVAGISSPLRSRFAGGSFKLEFYTHEEVTRILERSARVLDVDADRNAIDAIAARSRFTPRTANYFLKRARDYAQVYKQNLDTDAVHEALSLLDIDEYGLSRTDRDLLDAVVSTFGGGPVGLNTLAAALGDEEATIEDFHEPYLIQTGLLERTPRGRVATPEAYRRLGYEVPSNNTLM